jgi:isopentenyl-diphosphate delta-isomerase
MTRTVTVVDEQNRPLGQEEIIKAHTGEGTLHRAFSVYVFREGKKEILIQKRSKEKMLWPLIWANTCCSHPFENEGASEAGERRLHEELGFTTRLSPAGTFVYRAKDPSGRGVEHEHVTILVGYLTDHEQVQANPAEIAEWKWIKTEELQTEMKLHPDQYAPWFHQGLSILLAHEQ